jgi:hypothetical protein
MDGGALGADVEGGVMAIVKDNATHIVEWVDYELHLREFSSITVDEGRVVKNHAQEIADVIAKHSPFKDNVAYMPVPRCETCVHFVPYPSEKPNGGTCIGPTLAGETIPISFGCIEHKDKP